MAGRVTTQLRITFSSSLMKVQGCKVSDATHATCAYRRQRKEEYRQFTALMPSARPTANTEPTTQCVVEVGIFSREATSTVIEAPNSVRGSWFVSMPTLSLLNRAERSSRYRC